MQILALIAPFFLSAFLFQSTWFAFVSPLPIFILNLKKRPFGSLLAIATNAAILYSTREPINEIYVAIGMWLGVGFIFPICVRKFGKIHDSFLISFLFMVAALLGALWFQANHAHTGIVDYVRSEISMGMDKLIELPNSPVKKMVEEQGRDALFKQLMTEIPAAILISMILCLWVNLLFASQIVRGFLSKNFWASYRNPEWLIWPTLVFGGLFAFTEQAPYYFGLNGLKLTMVFYGFQGLSVISHLLNRYKILGIGRMIVFTLAIFVVMPVVLSLGFFDLWFDFRKKFGHS